jgi:hypothetical protein
MTKPKGKPVRQEAGHHPCLWCDATGGVYSFEYDRIFDCQHCDATGSEEDRPSYPTDSAGRVTTW